jgi:hypothetical protein
MQHLSHNYGKYIANIRHFTFFHLPFYLKINEKKA